MAPMYLGRWIVFYMDIIDRVYAGTKEVEAQSSRIEPIVKKAQASVCNENLFPHHKVCGDLKPLVYEVHGQPKPLVVTDESSWSARNH